MTGYTIWKTTVGFIDGLAETNDSWPPRTTQANFEDENLTEFLTVEYQEYTRFEWNGPDEAFPHDMVTFRKKYSDDVVALSMTLDLGAELPMPANFYDEGLPIDLEGWIQRLAFGPDGVMYFGVEADDGQIVTVPIYLGRCEKWGDDDFTNIRSKSWRKFLDENAVQSFAELGDGDEIDSEYDLDRGPSLWIWEFELSIGRLIEIRGSFDSPRAN